MLSVREAIRQRRSVRAFQARDVPDARLREIFSPARKSHATTTRPQRSQQAMSINSTLKFAAIALALGAHIEDSVNTVVEQELVVARVGWRAAQPQLWRDAVEPAVALDALIEEANGRVELVKQPVKRVHRP